MNFSYVTSTFVQAETRINEYTASFLFSIRKLTAIAELLKDYEPKELKCLWEVNAGIASILTGIAGECSAYQERVAQVLKDLSRQASGDPIVCREGEAIPVQAAVPGKGTAQ